MSKCLQIKRHSIDFLGTYGRFVEVGEYPHQSYIPHLNHPLCGIGNITSVYVVSFNKQCFGNEYKNKTFVDISTEPQSGEEGQVLSRIFKGRNAKKGEAPWTVYIHKRFARNVHVQGATFEEIKTSYCTGSLLTFEWVITSAHCVNER